MWSYLVKRLTKINSIISINSIKPKGDKPNVKGRVLGNRKGTRIAEVG